MLAGATGFAGISQFVLRSKMLRFMAIPVATVLLGGMTPVTAFAADNHSHDPKSSQKSDHKVPSKSDVVVVKHESATTTTVADKDTKGGTRPDKDKGAGDDKTKGHDKDKDGHDKDKDKDKDKDGHDNDHDNDNNPGGVDNDNDHTPPPPADVDVTNTGGGGYQSGGGGYHGGGGTTTIIKNVVNNNNNCPLAPVVNVTVNDNDPAPAGMPWWLVPLTAAITVLGMAGAFLLGRRSTNGKDVTQEKEVTKGDDLNSPGTGPGAMLAAGAVLAAGPLVAAPAKTRTASVSAHAMALLGAIIERRGINEQLAMSNAAEVQEVVDLATAAHYTVYAVRGNKAQILFDAKQHTRRETTSVVSWLARSNAPSAQAKLADLLAHEDTSVDLEMESRAHAAAIDAFATANNVSSGAALENSFYQMNRIDTKLHAGYRIVAANSREEALTSAAIPMYDSLGDLSIGKDGKDAQEKGRRMSDQFRSLPHFTSRNDLRRLTVANQTVGFHPEVKGKIDRAKEELFVA